MDNALATKKLDVETKAKLAEQAIGGLPNVFDTSYWTEGGYQETRKELLERITDLEARGMSAARSRCKFEELEGWIAAFEARAAGEIYSVPKTVQLNKSRIR